MSTATTSSEDTNKVVNLPNSDIETSEAILADRQKIIEGLTDGCQYHGYSNAINVTKKL